MRDMPSAPSACARLLPMLCVTHTLSAFLSRVHALMPDLPIHSGSLGGSVLEDPLILMKPEEIRVTAGSGLHEHFWA